MKKHCDELMIGVEYYGMHPNHYDGVSEWKCAVCHKRFGRWTGKEIKVGESEKPFGGVYDTSDNRND